MQFLIRIDKNIKDSLPMFYSYIELESSKDIIIQNFFYSDSTFLNHILSFLYPDAINGISFFIFKRLPDLKSPLNSV